MTEEILGLVIMAIALYLILRYAPAANNILNSLGNGYRGSISALQGGV